MLFAQIVEEEDEDRHGKFFNVSTRKNQSYVDRGGNFRRQISEQLLGKKLTNTIRFGLEKFESRKT